MLNGTGDAEILLILVSAVLGAHFSLPLWQDLQGPQTVKVCKNVEA